MYAQAQRDINKYTLLNSDDADDGNEWLRQYYNSILQDLMLLPLSQVPCDILRDISALLFSTQTFDEEWKNWASKLGVTGRKLFAKIRASAKSREEQELYLTLTCVLPHKTFGHVITMLMDERRYDVLIEIQDDVKSMLEYHATTHTDVKQIASTYKQLPGLTANKEQTAISLPESNSETVSSVEILSYNSNKLDTFASGPSSLEKHNHEKVITLQQNHTEKNSKNVVQNHSILVPNKPSSKKNSVKEVHLFSTSPPEERVTVFIQHTESDSCNAEMLARKLKDGGIFVKTLADNDIKVQVMLEPRKALQTIFQEVDFIVPIVSEKLLEQIHAANHEAYLEDTDAMNNKWLHQLMMNEYTNNRFINFRVRPVIVPEMKRKQLSSEVLLSMPFRLWAGVGKLIQILKDTKQLIPHYALVNSVRNT